MKNLLDFVRGSNLFKKFQVDNLLFTEFKCPAEETKSGIWWHNNFFAFILSGESLLKTPKKEYTLKPGHCVFARKGSVISMSQTQEEFCELLIFVPDDFIKNVIQKYKIPIVKRPTIEQLDTIFPIKTDDVLQSYFQSLLSYFFLPDPPSDALLKLKFEELIVHIVSNRNQTRLKWYFQEICTREKLSIREIMDYNFSSNLSLGEFAQLCGRSLSSFRREFVRLYGMPPGKWLKIKRLEYSRYLLETTSLNVEEVCFESGFENRSHFIRIFGNEYGLTPGKFQKRK